jgi:hypothetical protein
MIRYKVQTVTLAGRPASRFVREFVESRGTFPHYPEDTGPAQEQELVLEPEVYINVWNCRANLAVEFCLPGTSAAVAIPWPRSLPKRVAKAIEDDIYAQGGAINISGRYEILSEKIWEFVESPRFQKWLRREAEQLGLEVVGEPDEGGPAPAE